MDVPGSNLDGSEFQQNTYQVYHKEGLLSQQSSVVPNAPLLYEQQVLLSKLRQQGNASKENKRATTSPSSHKFPHNEDSASQDTDDSRSDVCLLHCVEFIAFTLAYCFIFVTLAILEEKTQYCSCTPHHQKAKE
jgi:hypothetical protein